MEGYLFRIGRQIAICLRVGAHDEGLLRLRQAAIAMEVSIFANGRWRPVHLESGRRSTVMTQTSSRISNICVFVCYICARD